MKERLNDLANGLEAIYEVGCNDSSMMMLMFARLIGLLQGYCDRGKTNIEISKIHDVLQNLVCKEA